MLNFSSCEYFKVLSIQHREAKIRATRINADGQREIITILGIVLIVKIFLRIESDEREPAGLNLDHQAMPGKKIMVNVRHAESHFHHFSIL